MHTFFEKLLQKRSCIEDLPSNKVISDWAINLLTLLYPETNPSAKLHNINEIEARFHYSKTELITLLKASSACNEIDDTEIATQFFQHIPSIYDKLNHDILAILNGDPAAKSEFEVIRAYPGFLATAIYRIAHLLHKLDTPLIPRILTEYAHSVTGIDIHPGAQIGDYFFIDHGTGIVIGETCVIGNHVKLYQGVTLGALSVSKAMQNEKRHPNIEDEVIIYAGATILGGDTTVGAHSIIGGNVWLTESVPAHSRVFHQESIRIKNALD